MECEHSLEKTKCPTCMDSVGSELSERLGGSEGLITCLWCGGSTNHETAVGDCCWEGWKREIGDLSMLVRQLAISLRKLAPDNEWPTKAIDYLKRHNLQGSILRDGNA